MSNSSPAPKKVGSWYFGGTASAMAAACTHPLDLIKVHLQTQQKKEVGMIGMGIRVVKRDGFFALYNGISASILRQLTYSMTRFGMYETYKQRQGRPLTFAESGVVASISGFCGGIVGNPADMVNVRCGLLERAIFLLEHAIWFDVLGCLHYTVMAVVIVIGSCSTNNAYFRRNHMFYLEGMQNDVKIPPAERRNYKHAVDGLLQVVRKEGPLKLFNGVSMTATRAAFMTFGQLAFYDKFKIMLIASGYFEDKPLTHMTASAMAAGVATCITQPFDVMKTRLMNAPSGKYSGLLSCGMDIAATGPLSFFKGLVPAFIRLAPHTVLTFVFLEQLIVNFGRVPAPPSKPQN